MAGRHWGERDSNSSAVENALIGIFSAIATVGFYGGLVLAAVAMLRAETCTVTRVSDGDTIRANCTGSTRTIRVSSIDSPEFGQPYGTEAKAATSALVVNRAISVRAVDYDRYGRTVAFVGLADRRDLGRELVRAGAAWHYLCYSQDAELAKLEAEARAASLGLWADPLPEPPAVYRAARRRRSVQRRQGQGGASGALHGTMGLTPRRFSLL